MPSPTRCRGLTVAATLIAGSFVMAAPSRAGHVTGNGVTYTSPEDFHGADLINLVVREDGSVDLDDTTEPFGFIWVAVSTKGTVVKIDTDTGAVVGEYHSSPSGMGKDPSRTTIDKNGNVWVSNRAESASVPGRGAMGSIIHIGLEENGQCVDRNGNGTIDTSHAQNDLKPWTNAGGLDTFGGVRTAADECIIHYVRVNSTGTRHVSVNAANDVWVSGTGERDFDLIDGDTGAILRTEASVGCGGYGGLIDGNDVIWSARPMLRWDTSKPLTAGNYQCYGHDSYGLAIDPSGNVWNTALSGVVYKFSPAGSLIGTYPHGSSSAQGVVADRNGDIWVAHALFGATTVGHLRNDGSFVGNVTVGVGPTGVSVDANGKVWSTNYTSRNVSRIDPLLNGGIGGTDLTSVDLGGNLYNYSDMTGSVLVGAPVHGTMVLTHDSLVPGNDWDLLLWNREGAGPAAANSSVPDGGALTVEVASSNNGTTFSSYVPATNGGELPVPNGRYLRLRFVFDRDEYGVSPNLTDLTIGRRATSMSSRAAIARVDAVDDYEIYHPDVEATLTDAETGAPISGQSISFSTSVDGQPVEICMATTDVDGRATCTASTEASLAMVRGDGYQARYAGDGERWFGSGASAGLLVGDVFGPG